MKLGRATKEETTKLEVGMDFRLPEYRREVFLRFYEFHLKFGSHPGCVYYLFNGLAKHYKWSLEERLWFAYINGNTQNPVTSWLIIREFPSLADLNMFALTRWFNANYDKLAFDTDRRYFKKSFLACVENYQHLVGDKTQEEFFAAGKDAKENFRQLWKRTNAAYIYFGRLSIFSYLEYLRIMGLPVDCDQLFLDDLQGSKSHRNGLCKVLGRDDLDWHDSNPSFDGRYDKAMIAWLKEEGEQLVADARVKMKGKPYAKDVGYFTLESALCTYKSWHRPNRRYPNVYNDLLVDRIRKGEEHWGQLDLFWNMRKATQPQALLLECNPADPGVKPVKQNHYRETGEVIMMDEACGGWACFKNRFNDKVRGG